VSEARLDLNIDGIGSSYPELESWKNSISRRVQDIFESPDVLRKIALSFGIDPAYTRVKTRWEPNSRKITIRVTASTAPEAKQLGEALLKAAISASRPRGGEQVRLEAEVKRIEGDVLLLETTYLKVRE